MSLEVNASTQAYASVSATKAATKSAVTTKNAESEAEVGAVYEKSSADSNAGAYKINKMSSEDRAALVQQLKADQEARQNQLTDLVNQMLSAQGTAYNNANDIWALLSSGQFTVDPATKAQAQADISEDGYWGVKQTSQRMFDFASALAGDDVDKMKKMQEAMMKGYEQATKTWGKELPSISKETIDAANKLFDDYYASKNA